MVPQHLDNALSRLSAADRAQLSADIASQDFALLDHLFHHVAGKTEAPQGELSPMPFRMTDEDPRHEMWTLTGEALLRSGQAAAFLVAGGQGSRLGFEGPKGAFDIGLPSHKSIFQLQAERLLHLQRRFGCPVPWCIMTSPLNHEATVAHFEEHGYFGLQRDRVRFFPQGMICAIGTDGQALRESPSRLALVPDGNGGCFRALAQSGSLEWLHGLGVRHVFLYGVDNVLAKVCDPLFLGALASSSGYASASKVVHKRSASEKVGIFALRDGKPGVIEYSDLPDSLRDARTPDGELAYDGGNIATHLFKIDSLFRLESEPLPWHAAFKKVAWCDDSGAIHQPDSPNAWKFEQFLFDSFPLLGTMLPLGVRREEEFAPVKNADGDDSPRSARIMLGTLHREWLQAAGVPVSPGKYYEISPLLSYAGEGLSPEVFVAELGKGILEFSEA